MKARPILHVQPAARNSKSIHVFFAIQAIKSAF